LFCDEGGAPITEYLPVGHEGLQMYGEVKDPTPDQGRALRHRADEYEKELIEQGRIQR
jgi:ferredoxin-thioredoxin reductase catalytic chain